MTLEDYFRKNIEKGITNFEVVAKIDDEDVLFDIHPMNQDDDTLSFLVTYNELEEW